MKLECDAKGDQPLSLSWMKDSSKIQTSEKIDIVDSLTRDGIRSELHIPSVSREEAGIYVCVAENSHGRDERINKVLVLEPPSSPSNLVLKKVWSRSASVSWASSSTGNVPVTSFIILYWKETKSRENSKLFEHSISSSQNEFLLKDLIPGTTYEVAVVAVNDVGRSVPSPYLKIKTGEEEPSSPPFDVYAEPKGPSTIRITWKPPPQEAWNGQPEGFYVGYRPSSGSEKAFTFRTVAFTSPDVTYEYFLPGLMPQTDYTITVKAFNLAGLGPESQIVSARTYSGDFAPPPKVSFLSVDSTSVSLRFGMNPAKPIVGLNGFTVHFRSDNQMDWKEIKIPLGSQSDGDFTAKDLTPNSVYHFYVTAINSFGNGDPSSLLSIKTKNSDTLLSTASSQWLDFGDDVNTFVPLVAASIIIVTVVLSYSWVKKAKLQSQMPPVDYITAALERGGAMDQAVFVGTTRRYVELGETSSGNLMCGNPRASMFVAPTESPWNRPLPKPGAQRKSILDPSTSYDFPH